MPPVKIILFSAHGCREWVPVEYFVVCFSRTRLRSCLPACVYGCSTRPWICEQFTVFLRILSWLMGNVAWSYYVIHSPQSLLISFYANCLHLYFMDYTAIVQVVSKIRSWKESWDAVRAPKQDNNLYYGLYYR